MGFTIANYSLFGLQPQNFYVSIHGTFQIRKERHSVVPNTYEDPTSHSETRAQDQNCYVVIFTIYYQASANSSVIMKKEDCFSIEQLPDPADVYSAIYANIKMNLGDLQYTDD